MKESTRERLQLVVHYREVEGLKFAAIGEKIGVTKSRANQIYRQSVRHKKAEANGDVSHELSVRTCNCLYNKFGEKPTAEIFKKVAAMPDAELLAITNFGKVCLRELRQFLLEEGYTDE